MISLFAELTAWHSFGQRLQSDEALRTTLSNWDGSYQSPQEQTPPSAPAGGFQQQTGNIPEDIDTDDPTVKFLLNRIQQQEEQLARLDNNYQFTAARVEESQRQQLTGIVNTATKAFQDKYQLSDDETRSIGEIAGRTAAAATYMQGIHPLTGLPVQPDPIAAITTAMDMAIWSQPEYRQKVIDNAVDQKRGEVREDRGRKQKLSALSGSSGSTPRTTTPTTEKEVREAMLAEITEAMGGT